MMNIKKKIAMALTTTALGAMLIGAGTFAFFNDSATNDSNTFTTGTLRVQLKDNAQQVLSGPLETLTFQAPGDSKDGSFVVANSGSLAMKFNPYYTKTNASTLPLDIKLYSDAARTVEIARTDFFKLSGSNEVVKNSDDTNAPTSMTIYYKISLPTTVTNGTEYANQGNTYQFSFDVDARQVRNNPSNQQQ